MSAKLRGDGSNGIACDSAHRIRDECVALFYPDLVSPCVQDKPMMYGWDGAKTTRVPEASTVRRKGAAW